MKVLQFIFTNLGTYKRLFFIVIFAGIINSFVSFFIPVTLANFANNPFNFSSTIITVVSLYCVSLLVSYIIRGRGEALTTKYANGLRLKYFRELAALPLGRLRKKHSGYMQSLVNKVADGIQNILFGLVWNLIPGIVLIVLFFIYIGRESLLLAFINLVLMVVFVTVSSLLARKMVPLAAEQNRRSAALLGSFADFMANITTVSQLGIRPYAQSVLGNKASHSNQQVDTLQQFHARRWFLLHALFGLAYMLTIGFLLWQISQGAMTLGLLILFVSAYGMLRGTIEQFSENIKGFMEMRAYIEELDEILGTPPKGSQPSKHSWQSITLQNVTFTHTGGTETIRVPYFSLTQGQKVCIEGKSGQGKSTFLSLLVGAYEPSKGECLVDKQSYNSIGRSFFDSNVAIIAQEAELFHISVRDNLTLGNGITDTTLKQYLKQLHMDDWLNSLDKGLDSIIGEKGVTLSAGQRQRLNILRAILLDRSLYILDEPTSHLDAHTEKVVIEFLQKQLKNKAAVIVTHRPALSALCTVEYSMKNHTLHPVNDR